jgi:release factor glutamine methyltransferase
MRKIKKRIIRTVGYFVLWYLRKDRYYSHQGTKILVKKGVFHPGFFFSTKLLLSTLATFNIKSTYFLELGAGSGLISFIAAKREAIVTATDISPIAINGLIENNKNLGLGITIVKSNLFDNIPIQKFDFIVINPPYYPKNPKTDAQKAWFCGENFEYFEKLFTQLASYLYSETIIFMSLSEDCEIERINNIANKFNFSLVEYVTKYTLWERNYIFKIISK